MKSDFSIANYVEQRDTHFVIDMLMYAPAPNGSKV